MATLLSADFRIVVECIETKAEMQHRGDDDMTTTAAQTNINKALGRECRAMVGTERFEGASTSVPQIYFKKQKK